MSTTTHPQICRCSLHSQIAAHRHERYRQLAHAILGPGAPKEDLALAHALAEHAALLEPANNVTQFRPRRAA
ncbi:MAG TPA: hypothetical protein VGE94_10180 [Chloroflexota bacterium]